MRILINQKFDVPYLAGYNTAGTIIYVDRRLPAKVTIGRSVIDPLRYLLVHELTEQHLEDTLSLPYLEAHHIATAAERAAVERDGLDWGRYSEIISGHVRVAENSFTHLPPDLDLEPYVQADEKGILRRIHMLQRTAGLIKGAQNYTEKESN